MTKMPPCGHLVHDECARSWFDTKNQEREQRCPFCNKALLIADLRKKKESRENNNFKAQMESSGSVDGLLPKNRRKIIPSQKDSVRGSN